MKQLFPIALKNEVLLTKEDITKARENESRRRISKRWLVSTVSHLNENTEVRKLKAELTALKGEVNNAKANAEKIAEDKKLVESKLRISEDRANRNQVMTDLLAP